MNTFSVHYTEVDPHQVTHRLIRNPNYGGKSCEVPGTCVIPIIERKIKPKFFIELRANVALDGFRNPIVLYRVHEYGLLLSFGGSRLRVAKELDKIVPAVIVDYVGDYTDCEEVTPDNYGAFFRDVPVYFVFDDVGVDTHYSLERNRREFYDPAGMEWTKDHEGDKDFLAEEFSWISNPDPTTPDQ